MEVYHLSSIYCWYKQFNEAEILHSREHSVGVSVNDKSVEDIKGSFIHSPKKVVCKCDEELRHS